MPSPTEESTPQSAPPESHPPLQPSMHGGWELHVELAQLEKPLDWSRFFGRNARVEIEIGIGSGYFLSRYGAAHPDINLLGIDKVGSETRRTADKCRRAGHLFTRVLRCDALYFLEDYPPDASVGSYHIYYSDPWPKTRHHKRRLWCPRLMPILQRTLAPGGDLFVKTDVTELYEVIQGLLPTCGFMERLDSRRLDHEPMEGDYETNFQRKAVEAGHPLYYERWRRK